MAPCPGAQPARACYGPRVSLEAIVLLKIPYAEICAAHDIEPAASAAQALEELSTFIPLGKNGTACMLDMPLDSPAADLATAMWSFVGDKLASHADERGFLIVADKGLADADLGSYEAAVAHFGDAGQWIKPAIGEAQMQAAAAEQMQAMLGGGVGSSISDLQAQLSANPQMMAALGEAPSGDLLQMAQQMLAQMSPAQQAQLEQMAKSMFGNLDPSALGAVVGPAAGAQQEPADDDHDPEFGTGDEPDSGRKKPTP